MQEIIKVIVNWLWVNFLEPIFQRLDRWDVLWLGVLGMTAYLGSKWSAGYFNRTEEALWGASVIVIGIAWFIVRSIAREYLRIRKLKTRASFIKLCLLVMIAAAWTYFAYSTYQIPRFAPSVIGFYVARFGSDPNDDYQERIARQINDFIDEQAIDNAQIQVQKLPRRISSEEQAQQTARKGGAALVLWGDRQNPQLNAHLTIVRDEGIFTSTRSLGGSRGFRGEITNIGLPRELEVLGRVLALFFAGYGYYHRATPDYEKAADRFKRAAAELLAITQPGEGLTPERRTLGSIAFYLGNSYWLKGDPESAKNAYRDSIKATSVSDEPQFVEPLNNLGFMLLEENGKGDLQEAQDRLTKAEGLCRNRVKNFVCTDVSYNLAALYSLNHDYGAALKKYEDALTSFNALPETERDYGLLANLHQQRAANYCLLALESDPDANSGDYAQAKQELDEAVAVWQRMHQPVPPFYNITKGRVYLGLAQWTDAVKALKTAESDLRPTQDYPPDFYALLATSYLCLKDSAAGARYLGMWQRSGSLTEKSWENYKRVINKCGAQ